jgi:hypothetical protein
VSVFFFTSTSKPSLQFGDDILHETVEIYHVVREM